MLTSQLFESPASSQSALVHEPARVLRRRGGSREAPRESAAVISPPVHLDRAYLRHQFNLRKSAGLKSRALAWDNGGSPLSSAQAAPPVLAVARNGNYSKVSMPELKGSRSVRARGDRGNISEFSARSRRALLTLVNSINRDVVSVHCVRFVTLTFPGEFPTIKASKRHLDALLKRFERHWGRRAIIWKIEPQGRGAPHFHLLVLMPLGSPLDVEIR